jgi:hypothetical protein
MAVLFQAPAGYMLNPSHQAELLQGFINIQNAVGSTDGRLTKSQMTAYQQQHTNAIDSTTAVANYLNNNFDTLSGLATKDNALSVDDLVRWRKDTPDPNVNNIAPQYTNVPPVSTQTQADSFIPVPVFIPIPVPVQAPIINNGQSNNYAYDSSPYDNSAFDPSVPAAPDMSQFMLMVLSQMMEMLQSLFTPVTAANTNF